MPDYTHPYSAYLNMSRSTDSAVLHYHATVVQAAMDFVKLFNSGNGLGREFPIQAYQHAVSILAEAFKEHHEASSRTTKPSTAADWLDKQWADIAGSLSNIQKREATTKAKPVDVGPGWEKIVKMHYSSGYFSTVPVAIAINKIEDCGEAVIDICGLSESRRDIPKYEVPGEATIQPAIEELAACKKFIDTCRCINDPQCPNCNAKRARIKVLDQYELDPTSPNFGRLKKFIGQE